MCVNSHLFFSLYRSFIFLQKKIRKIKETGCCFVVLRIQTNFFKKSFSNKRKPSKIIYKVKVVRT